MRATRHPVIQDYMTFQEKRSHTKMLNSGLHLQSDPWRVVCEHCQLDDCILPEGGAGGNRAATHLWGACLIVAGKKNGLTPEQVLQGVKKLDSQKERGKQND